MTTFKEDRLFNAEAADYLGVKPETLNCWRSLGRYSIPFVKIGRRVCYRQSDLDAFIASRTHTQTA